MRYKCVKDCWHGKDPLGQYLYIQGTEYEMTEDHPCAIHFVDEKGKYLKEPPPLRKPERLGDPDLTIANLANTVAMLLAEREKPKSVGDEALEKMGLGEKRGPGRPPKE